MLINFFFNKDDSGTDFKVLKIYLKFKMYRKTPFLEKLIKQLIFRHFFAIQKLLPLTF